MCIPQIAAALLVGLAAYSGAARGTGLSACGPEGGPELTPQCREALARASAGDVLALVEPWISARRYGRARLVLEEALRGTPWNTALKQRLHEVQSLADEAAWLARRQTAPAAEPDVDVALAETRCTRLTGEAALEACNLALQQRPDNVRLLVARGDLLLTLGRAAEAEASYRAAAQREPSPVLERKIAIARGAVAPASPAQADDRDVRLDAIRFGRYHALVIGNDAYRHLDRLETAVHDAKTIAALLRTDYGFEVTVLTDATRADIVETLDEYRNRLQATDNLLIYYAGHGWLDAEADKGYWLPVDAQQDKRTQWVSNDTVRDTLRALRAKHVLVIADSCFSGTLTRDAAIRTNRGREFIERTARLKARQVLTSGSLEPVADSVGSGHSPFAIALLRALRSNRAVLDATSLFSELRRPVALNSEQMPQFADIRMAGHEGGDFLFVRRK